MGLLEKIKAVATANNEPMDKLRVKHYGHPDKWPKDRNNAFEYFRDKPEILKIILDYFKTHNNESLNHFDIAGRASFNSSEKRIIDNIYYFIKSNLGRENENGEHYIEGDIMSNEDFESGLEEIKSKNILFDIVTFQPVGGLDEYSPDLLSEYLIESQESIKFELMKIFLKRIIELKKVIKTGGLLYLGESHLLSEFYKDYSDYLEDYFKRLGFEVLAIHKNYSHVRESAFLLKKVS